MLLNRAGRQDWTTGARERQCTNIRIEAAELRSEFAGDHVKGIGVDVTSGSESGQVVQIEIDGELAANAIVSHTEAAAHHALAVTSEDFSERIVAEVR